MIPTAAELMRRHVVTLDDEAMMGMVEGQMKLENVRHVAIVDASGRLVGIVSRGDVLRAMDKGAHQLVSAHMTRRLFTVRPDTPVTAAVKIMEEHDVGAVPVVDDAGRLQGMLVEADFLALARQALGAGLLPASVA